MKLLVSGILLAAAMHAQVQSLRLEPGEYRWNRFSVEKTPMAVDCRFRVLQGGATVHMEVLRAVEFRKFIRNREYDMFASTPDGRAGQIQRIFDVARRKAGIKNDQPPLSTAAFRRPGGRQLEFL